MLPLSEIVSRAELTVEQFVPAIVGALITALAFLATRFYTRMDADRDELIKLREAVGAIKKENARQWEVIEEISKAKKHLE